VVKRAIEQVARSSWDPRGAANRGAVMSAVAVAISGLVESLCHPFSTLRPCRTLCGASPILRDARFA